MSDDEIDSDKLEPEVLSQDQRSDSSSDHSEAQEAEFRSSPPLPETDQTAVEGSSQMDKKRSLDEMNDMDDKAFPSSATMVGDVPPSVLPVEEAVQTDTYKPSMSAHGMLPPPKPTPNISSPSQTAPASAQILEKPDSPDGESTVAMTEERQEAPSPASESTPSNDTPDVMGNPKLPIASFDWANLHIRYHDTMDKLNEREQGVVADFEKLCEFFTLWSHAGSTREVDRSFKRLKTQSAYVEHEEGELEKRRQHYIRVVDAFRTAIELLKQ